MPNPTGFRRRTPTSYLTFRLPDKVMADILLLRPELFDPDQPGVFRYGALSKYLTQLVILDLRKRRLTALKGDTPDAPVPTSTP